ncbi:hypothetical protein OG422_17175 [Streptomyces sp. NBC_01525]|uniref:hypothetical protein n=1 Tax=Streptomyces TaxID=1883 RepID=UPI00163DBEE6|nr:hypothetical protein [Streptomyces benahoarensis]
MRAPLGMDEHGAIDLKPSPALGLSDGAVAGREFELIREKTERLAETLPPTCAYFAGLR